MVDAISAALLAGGRGKRMRLGASASPTGKLDEAINGLSLSMRAYSSLRKLFPEVLTVVGADGLPATMKGLDCIKDDPRLEGPAAGIAAALSKTGSWCFVAAADMPFIDISLIIELVKDLGSIPKGSLCAIPEWSKGLEPLHAFYNRNAYEKMMEYSARGSRSLSGLAAFLGAATLDAEEAARRCHADLNLAFFNVNTAEDLKLARQISTRLGI